MKNIISVFYPIFGSISLVLAVAQKNINPLTGVGPKVVQNIVMQYLDQPERVPLEQVPFEVPTPSPMGLDWLQRPLRYEITTGMRKAILKDKSTYRDIDLAQRFFSSNAYKKIKSETGQKYSEKFTDPHFFLDDNYVMMTFTFNDGKKDVSGLILYDLHKNSFAYFQDMPPGIALDNWTLIAFPHVAKKLELWDLKTGKLLKSVPAEMITISPGRKYIAYKMPQSKVENDTKQQEPQNTIIIDDIRGQPIAQIESNIKTIRKIDLTHFSRGYIIIESVVPGQHEVWSIVNIPLKSAQEAEAQQAILEQAVQKKQVNLEQEYRYLAELKEAGKNILAGWASAKSDFEKQSIIFNFIAQINRETDKNKLFMLLVELEDFLLKQVNFTDAIKSVITKRVNKLRQQLDQPADFAWE